MSKTARKVLIVDDNPVMAKAMTKILKGDGYLVFDAWNGEDGIKKAKEIYPDLIIMDIIMPDMDGKEAVHRIMAEPSLEGIPIIFVSNTLSVKKDKGSELLEVDGKPFRIFAKPIHNQKVLSVIRKTINKSVNDRAYKEKHGDLLGGGDANALEDLGSS